MKPARLTKAELAELTPEKLHLRLRQLAPKLSLEERFTLLHELGLYHGDESLSGDAASLTETKKLREALPVLLRRHEVKTILDVPCGDFFWMSRVDLGAVNYTGVDIVAELVEHNTVIYGSVKRSFVIADASADRLPAADLILCRDLFIHLSLADIARVLANFRSNGARLLLTNHFGDRTENPDILSGDFRPINLCRAPFDLPPPIETIDEGSSLIDGAFSDRAMGLWRFSQLSDL